MSGVEWRRWEDLSAQEQLELRVQFGHYLDRLPPTCSMQTKIARFAAWLAERGVHFEGGGRNTAG